MAICARLSEKNYRIDEPELKRLPPGTPKDHQHEAMLRRKSLAFWLDLPHPDELANADFVDFCMTHYNVMRPAYDWLADLE